MESNKILVTGGAGYIGTHIAKNLLKEGFKVIILDNLSTGFIEPVQLLQKKYKTLEFIKGDLADKDLLKKIFSKNIEAVIHLAAKVNVRESIQQPDIYTRENYLNSINLVETMVSRGVNKLVFSSTCAVYGEPKYIPIDEQHPTKPINPYSQTKLDFENYLEKVKNLQFLIFRFFNVGGSDPEGLIGKAHLINPDLTENIMEVALDQRDHLEIFGDDYNTEDGTPVRDYIHVEDISQAHISGLKNLKKLDGEIINLGSEKGFSVKEVIITAENVIRKTIPIKMGQRKEGDVACSVASAKKAKDMFGWQPQYSNLGTIIETDWKWRRKHPAGYLKK